MKYKVLLTVALICVLVVLPLFTNTASAQTQPSYYVTVKPEILPNALIYTSVDKNVTLSFVALWSYGSSDDQNIANATATIQVSDSKEKVVDTLKVNTTTGVFSFNYYFCKRPGAGFYPY